MLKFGIIGYGYWGPNVARNFHNLAEARVVKICDIDKKRREMAGASYRDVEIVADPMDVLHDPRIDAVAIVTPVFTHYELARQGLENGKHVFIEKPFCSTVSQGEELIEMAERKRLQIMVDHTFLFTGAVQKIKELMDRGELGNLYYYDSVRVNLGLFQHDINVIWDLAPHDISIMDYLLNETPIAVSAIGVKHFGCGLEDVAYLTVYFQNSLIAHFHVSWLSPVKIRMTIISGDKKMLVWDDMQPSDKIRVYDAGVKIDTVEGAYNLLVQYRSGDMWAPKIDQTEALKKEAEYFIECIKTGEKPFNNGEAGLKVVKILEASSKSLIQDGKKIKL